MTGEPDEDRVATAEDDDRVLAIREGRFESPPVDHRRVLVRSAVCFAVVASAVLLVGALVLRSVDRSLLDLAVMGGALTASISCVLRPARGPTGSVPAIDLEDRLRDRRIRRALRRDDPHGMSLEEYAEAVRRAPYIASRTAVQAGQVGWQMLATAVMIVGLDGNEHPVAPVPILVLLGTAAAVTEVAAVVHVRRMTRFSRRRLTAT